MKATGRGLRKGAKMTARELKKELPVAGRAVAKGLKRTAHGLGRAVAGIRKKRAEKPTKSE